MTTPAVFLPLDLTGTAPDNSIAGEYHQILSGSKTIIRPNFGGFYKSSFQLFGVNSQSNLTLLVEGVDYTLDELDTWATAQAAGDVYQIALVKNTHFFTTFSISYQALGGTRNINWTRLYQQSQQAQKGASTAWTNITGAPSAFNPAAHKNDALDLYGLEYAINFINEIKDAIHSSRVDAGKNIAIQNKLNAFKSQWLATSSNIPAASRAHIANTNYAHAYTKAMIGLGNISNYDFVAQIVAGVTQPFYASPQTLEYYTVTAQPTYIASSHPTLLNNPHNVTKAQLGLGNVADLGLLASYATGTDEYSTLISDSATEVYLGPSPFVNGVSEYAQNVYSTVTQPLVDSTISTANSQISQAQDILTATAAVQSSITPLLAALQTNTTAVNSDSSQATLQSNSYALLWGNAVYSQTLTQLSLYEHGAYLAGKGVYPDGFYPVPLFLDSLYLWVSASNPMNQLMVDINGAMRVTTLVDRSSYARVFSATANTAPILTASQDVVNQVEGITVGKVLRFTGGLALDKVSGADIKLKPGMTIIALVRTGDPGSQLRLLSAPNAQIDTGIYAFTSAAKSLLVKSGDAWNPIEAPDTSALPDTSGIVVGVISAVSESQCWLASTHSVDITNHPRGVNTPASTWPTSLYDGTPLTQIGNANFGINNQGEVAEFMIFTKALSLQEVTAVVNYLKLCRANSLALSVDYRATNAF